MYLTYLFYYYKPTVSLWGAMASSIDHSFVLYLASHLKRWIDRQCPQLTRPVADVTRAIALQPFRLLSYIDNIRL